MNLKNQNYWWHRFRAGHVEILMVTFNWPYGQRTHAHVWSYISASIVIFLALSDSIFFLGALQLNHWGLKTKSCMVGLGDVLHLIRLVSGHYKALRNETKIGEDAGGHTGLVTLNSWQCITSVLGWLNALSKEMKPWVLFVYIFLSSCQRSEPVFETLSLSITKKIFQMNVCRNSRCSTIHPSIRLSFFSVWLF